MTSFLFVVNVPDLHYQDRDLKDQINSWNEFLKQSKNILPNAQQNKNPSKNVWLFDAKNGLPVLLAFSSLADSLGLEYLAYLLPSEYELLSGKRTPPLIADDD